jgi:hypothetical protein
MAYKIQHLGLGGILDQAIAITRDHFGLLFTIMLILLVPFQLITGTVQHWAIGDFLQQVSMQEAADPAPAEAVHAFPMWYIPWSIGTWLFSMLVVFPLTNAAVIQAVARLYLGQPVTAAEAFRHGLRRLLPLIGTTILMTLAIMGGFFLLIIPGIVCMVWFGLSQHVTVLEDLAGSKALGRSKKLVGPHWATFFVLALLVGVLSYAIGAAAGFVPLPYVRLVISALLTAVVMIISTAAWVVFYFSCRCAEENFDLHYLAETIGAEPTETGQQFEPAVP